MLVVGITPANAPEASVTDALEQDLQAQAFAPLYHEIFNEPERAEVTEALLGWLDARVPPGI